MKRRFPGIWWALAACSLLSGSALAQSIVAVANSGIIACWGDSQTAGTGVTAPHGPPWPTLVAGLTGNVILNNGVGGNTSTQIKTRFLATPQLWNATTIILAGANNSSDPATVASDVAAMVAQLTHSRYIVLSCYATDAGSLANIQTINAARAAAYGSHYLDIFSFLMTQYNSSDSSDMTAHNAGIVAPSILDGGTGPHLNSTGHVALASFIARHLYQAQ